ncbi:MAG: DUF1775 domain-containing protein [Kofleriaceae bacterium]
MYVRSMLAAFAVSALFVSTADAHITIASGPAFANKTVKISIAINHGCDGADTVAVTVPIPATLTSVRTLTSDFGKATVTKTGTTVTAVTWTKAAADELAADDGYYELTIRARVGDVPFTKIQLTVIQTCKAADGTITVVPWDQPPGSTTGEPAPQLIVVPARQAGWNKFILPVGVVAADLPTYFGDALIAWRGTAAYSANSNTAAQISTTTGVTMLATDLAAADEIWVRY